MCPKPARCVPLAADSISLGGAPGKKNMCSWYQEATSGDCRSAVFKRKKSVWNTLGPKYKPVTSLERNYSSFMLQICLSPFGSDISKLRQFFFHDPHKNEPLLRELLTMPHPTCLMPSTSRSCNPTCRSTWPTGGLLQWRKPTIKRYLGPRAYCQSTPPQQSQTYQSQHQHQHQHHQAHPSACVVCCTSGRFSFF